MRTVPVLTCFVVASIVMAGCVPKARPIETDKPSSPITTPTPAAKPARGAVATVHPLASQAAIDAFDKGGNAIDAAVAAAVTLGVVDGHNSGIGGGCFMLIRTAGGELIALDGRETAPAAARRAMFLRNGRADPRLAQAGPLASGTPGSVAVYAEATRRAGRLSLADAFRPAADLAERGFEIDAVYAARIAATAQDIAAWPATRALLLHADGTPLKAGDVLRQRDLAETYRDIAEKGEDAFYTGNFARAVGAWMAANGGYLSTGDFATYRLKERTPIVSTYRGHTVVGFPPPSSGGLHVAQILTMLESFDLAALHRQDEALRLHVMIGAMNLAFADRVHWLGDPAFAKVPAGLLDADYLKRQASRITLDKALDVPTYGTPPDSTSKFFDDALPGRHTTHVATADAEGNVVALTATVNTAFGSKVIVPGTGVILNNQMDDFAIDDGTPNAFGLVGGDANAVAAGKRPLSSMSPTIVLKDGRPVLTVGAAGGPKIITQVVQAVSNVIDLGDDVRTALARKRVHMQWRPRSVWVERDLDPAVQGRLKRLGHTLEPSDPAGATQAIAIGADGTLTPAHDPRVPGAAMVAR